MNFNICGIPMVFIPHPQGPWLEAINPVTNQQWRSGVEPFMSEGAKYCLLGPSRHDPHYRESCRGSDLTVQNFSDYEDLLDTVGRDSVRSYWRKQDNIWLREKDIFMFQWRLTTSPKEASLSASPKEELDGNGQPAVDLSWAEAKAWTLMQGGLSLLTDEQWEWSAQGGGRRLHYATETGNLVDAVGRKLAHCGYGGKEQATIDVDDSKYRDGPFGLRHKTGNVLEWVERDLNEESPYGRRGGSWHTSFLEYLSVDHRRKYMEPDQTNDEVGFRVGASVPQGSNLLFLNSYRALSKKRARSS